MKNVNGEANVAQTWLEKMSERASDRVSERESAVEICNIVF